MIIFFDYKKIISFLIIICMICNFHTYICAVSLSDSDILAKSCAVLDGYNNRILFGKNENVPMANASTTKIMTCIVALENAHLDDYVLISKNAANQPKVRLGLSIGKEYRLKDLLYGLMLESFNDCAVAIAEHVSGNVKSFAHLMNQKAIQIGCENTCFITPNGLDAQENGSYHHTTAVDLCKIMKYCVWESPCAEDFLNITQTLTYECKDPEGQMHLFANHNQLFASDSNAISGKTGYTAKAGYCYVTAYEKDGLKFCIALLGCGWPNHKEYKWIDARKIVEKMKQEYTVSDIPLKQGRIQTKCEIINGYKGDLDLKQWNTKSVLQGEYIEKKLCESKYLHTNDEQIDIKTIYNSNLSLPIVKGKRLGRTSYYLNGVELESQNLVAAEDFRPWTLLRLFGAIFLQYF